MAHSIEWAESAISAVVEAADHIARDSPSYAAALIAKAEAAANSLHAFPERGRVVPEYGDATLRELFVGRYRLIYRISGKWVVVVAFVHGARDLRAVLPDLEQ